MNRARRLIGAGIAAAALALGLGSAALAVPTAASAASAAPASSMPACRTDQLAIWVNQKDLQVGPVQPGL